MPNSQSTQHGDVKQTSKHRVILEILEIQPPASTAELVAMEGAHRSRWAVGRRRSRSSCLHKWRIV